MNQELIKKEYDEMLPIYQQLSLQTTEQLKTLLNDNIISFHAITTRIKNKESYLDKIERKGYEDHKSQIEDLCGIRIICYYPEDLAKINDLIHNEFDIVECVDKAEQLEADRFGYRSDHYIVTITDDWAKAPSFRKLKNLKIEIQVRTILMHAWADIEHKLAYKSKDQIPTQFRRKLYQLSALLEIADSQFQDLKREKDKLKESLIIKSSPGGEAFDISSELNLDTLQALLDFHFPLRMRSEKDSSKLLAEIEKSNISLKELEKSILKVIGSFIDIDALADFDNNVLVQVGAVRVILDLVNDNFFEMRSVNRVNDSYYMKVFEMRKKFK